MEEILNEGEIYEVKVAAKNPHNEGIGRIKNLIVFIKNTKTRIGKSYRVKITKVYRTFAYAEALEGAKSFIGNGSLIV
ncbi:MAG: TRAM domain-containing protein [Candidatus Micrarchaeota archaeon]|nr:TRAM domain-containing protein [Candidatus Micrarchaeota archaeon]MDE1804746.1 TRAM domain-containing protein [Candidatus Micrarchaeota archaeon]MDE1847208.1 TRAM domain-containing protein [Candidatus Micrarchaeota archaeon]